MSTTKSQIITGILKEFNRRKPGFGDTREGHQVAEQIYERMKAAQHAGEPLDVAQIIELAKPHLPPQAFEEPDEVYWADAGLSNIQTGKAFRTWAEHRYPDERLPMPTEPQIRRVADMLDADFTKRQRLRRIPPIAVVRHHRADFDVTTQGTSWLGGLPTLGDLTWPRGQNGRPMHHLAQLDLRCISQHKVPPGLPDCGNLAFFASTDDDWPYSTKVLHIPTHDTPPTMPPQDLPPLFHGGDWGYYIKGHTHQNAPRVFPRWAVAFHALPFKTKRTDPLNKIGRLYPKTSDTYLSTLDYRESLPEFSKTYWWDTAQRFANSLIVAAEDVDDTIARARASAKRGGNRTSADAAYMPKNTDAFRQFVDQTVSWAFSQSAADPMLPQDICDLTDAFAKVSPLAGTNKPGFHTFYQNSASSYRSLDAAVSDTLLSFAQGNEEDYALLPPQIKADIDDKYSLPSPQNWHQMFGDTDNVQGAAEDHSHDYLLLQLHSDNMMNWMWADVGVIQFWISPLALENHDWDQVVVTMEGH